MDDMARTPWKPEQPVMVTLNGRERPARILTFPATCGGTITARVAFTDPRGGTDYVLPSRVRAVTEAEFMRVVEDATDLAATVAAMHLEGATNPPAEFAVAANAGEFAARWNAMDPEAREGWVQHIQRAQQDARDCWVASHTSRIAYLRTQQRLAEECGEDGLDGGTPGFCVSEQSRQAVECDVFHPGNLSQTRSDVKQSLPAGGSMQNSCRGSELR